MGTGPVQDSARKQSPIISRDRPRLTATSGAAEIKHHGPAETAKAIADVSRPTATDRDHDIRYVARLEGEVEFLRGQVGTKDAQIKELTERSRETNVLIWPAAGSVDTRLS
jgi:hypothetical protein